MKHFLYSLVLLLLLMSCGNNNSINTKKMNLAMLATDLEILAADDMEGRAPCTACLLYTSCCLLKRQTPHVRMTSFLSSK